MKNKKKTVARLTSAALSLVLVVLCAVSCTGGIFTSGGGSTTGRPDNVGAHEHKYENGFCTVCGIEYHECVGEEWVVVKDASCGVDGKKEHRCACGNTVATETVPALTHSFAFGYCGNCGDEDPDYTPPADSVGLEFKSSGDGTCYVSSRGSCRDKHVVIPQTSPNGDKVVGIGYEAFWGKGELVSIIIPEGVEYVSNNAFSSMYTLETVVFPSTMKRISGYAFDGCTGLKNVYVADLAAWCGVNFSGSYPFKYGAELYVNGKMVRDLVIPDGVTQIGVGAFAHFDGIRSVTIPDSVTSIGGGAFYSCDGIKSIVIPDSVTTVGAQAIYYCLGLRSVSMGKGVVELSGGNFDACYSLQKIDVDPENPSYCSIDGVLFNKDATVLLMYAKGKVGTYAVPNGVIEIADNAFSGCETLTGITLPEGLLTIGGYAFRLCNGISSLDLPESLYSVGWYAFMECSALSSLTVRSKSVVGHTRDMLNGCALTEICVPAELVEQYKNTSGWRGYADIIKPID